MTISSSPNSAKLLKHFNLIVLLLSVASANAQVQINDFGPFKFQLEESFSPVHATELEQEIAEVIEGQEGIKEEDIRAMNYWNASYPSYRWHQIMMEISSAHKGHKNGGRVIILHLSIYDALVEVWKHKKLHQVHISVKPCHLYRSKPCHLYRMKGCQSYQRKGCHYIVL